MDVIIHFGVAKTGTTSLQYALHRGRRELMRHGVSYPKPPHGIAHHILAALIADREALHPWLLYRYGGDYDALMAGANRFWAEIVERTGKRKWKALVLSSEFLWSHASDDASLERLKALVEPLVQLRGGRIRPVVYVRDPADWFLSSRQETTKVSATPLNTGFISYRWPLERIEAVLGDVAVRPFVREALAGGDVVSDFRAHFLADVPDDLLQSVRRNETLSAEAMDILHSYNRWKSAGAEWSSTDTSRALRRRLETADAAGGAVPAPVLKPAVRDEIYRRAQDLGWLRERHGIVFPKVDYAIAGSLGDEAVSFGGGVPDIVTLDQTRRDVLLMTVLDEAVAEANTRILKPPKLRYGGPALAAERLRALGRALGRLNPLGSTKSRRAGQGLARPRNSQ